MIKLTTIVVVCICACLIDCTPNRPARKTVAPITHKVKSIKNLTDSIAIDPMIILKNENLDAFIEDLKASRITLSSKLKSMPSAVKAFLEDYGGDKFTIANPGKDWNCCCERNDALPNRQLICQGDDGHLFLISYLTGGIGEINHLILIRYDGKTITDFWTGTLWQSPNTKNSIVEYLLKNKNKHWGLNTNIITI